MLKHINAKKFCHATILLSLVLLSASCSNDDNESVSENKVKSADGKRVEKTTTTQSNTLYKANIIPENVTVQEKKRRFAFLVAPAVDEVHSELMKQFELIESSIKSGNNSELISQLREEYSVENNQELLKALKPHPQSIGMAQAAMESGWATSRFFKEANNIFGVWSFDENEPRIAASQKRQGKTIWVKKYPTIKASVEDYYRVLSKSSFFKDFRSLKMKTSNPYKLVKELDSYSEKGSAYGEELAAMIKFNKFETYDD